MPWPAIVAGIASAGAGLIGASKQAKAQKEAAEAARDLPDWLKPYYIGDAGPSAPPVPINYNWLNAMAQTAQTGTPQNIPPMNMNNPMMTLENVYTPYGGGPWGHGFSPGQRTIDIGAPGGPVGQFLPQPAGFTPSAVNPQQSAVGGETEPGGVTPLDRYILLQHMVDRYKNMGDNPPSAGLGDISRMASYDPERLRTWGGLGSLSQGAIDQLASSEGLSALDDLPPALMQRTGQSLAPWLYS